MLRRHFFAAFGGLLGWFGLGRQLPAGELEASVPADALREADPRLGQPGGDESNLPAAIVEGIERDCPHLPLLTLGELVEKADQKIDAVLFRIQAELALRGEAFIRGVWLSRFHDPYNDELRYIITDQDGEVCWLFTKSPFVAAMTLWNWPFAYHRHGGRYAPSSQAASSP